MKVNRQFDPRVRFAWCAALALLIGVGLAGESGARWFRSDADADGSLRAGTVALEDGFYALAVKHLEAHLRRAEDATERVRATLLLAEALVGLERYDEAAERLTGVGPEVADGPMAPLHSYWLARVDYLEGNHEAVIHRLLALEAKHQQHEILPRARLLRARSLLALEQTDEALTLLDRAYAAHPEAPESAEYVLDAAAALLREHRRDEAEAWLQLLVKQHDGSPASAQGRVWLGQLLIEAGRWNEARALLTPLMETEEAPAPHRVTALFALAEVEEAQGRNGEALAFLESGLALAPESAERTRARLAKGRLLIRTGETEKGLGLLRNTVRGQRSEAEAGAVQIQLARLLFDQGFYEQALAEYQRYLEAFSDSPDAVLAMEGRAWCLWEMARYAEAAKAFDRAALAVREEGRKAEYLFKAADSYLADGQTQLALESYSQFINMFPEHRWTEKAHYQTALCQIRREDYSEGESILRGLIEGSADEDLAETAAMRLARLFEERRRWEDAVSGYDALMQRFPQGRRNPEALYRRGVGRYRLGQFAEANSDFESLLKRFPESEPAEQAFYMRGFAHYMMEQPVEAVRIAGEFLDRHPASRWAPRVLTWLGEYHYNLGHFEEAEAHYLRLSSNFPRSAEAPRALLEAARSAYANKEFLRAIEHVKLLAQNYPNSASMPDARFLHGDALSELGDFASSILAFEEILNDWPDSYLAPAALGRIGDCHFTLGSTDEPDRFRRAFTRYKAVVDRPDAHAELKLQAMYKMARCQEKMGEPGPAFEGYMEVVLKTFNAWEQGQPVGSVWFTRAAFAAAALKEADAQWRDAIRIYRRVVDAGIPAAEEAERRIRKIRLEQMILL